MARKTKRQYGSGCLMNVGGRWAIRWRETEIAPDGSRKRVLRYESLRTIPRKAARSILAQRMADAGFGKAPTRSRVIFRTLAAEWQVSVLPMYKPSTRKNHAHILQKHLLQRFGETHVSELRRQDVQSYVAHVLQLGYAPKTIGHIRDVLSAILRTTVKWDHIQEAPARGVDLPALRTVRPKWVLTGEQAESLIFALPLLARTLVGLAILTGLRRGELFAQRWRDVDEQGRCLTVTEAVYEGQFGTPKTGSEYPANSAHRCYVPPSDAVAATGQTHRCWILGVLDKVRKANFTEQHPASVCLPCL